MIKGGQAREALCQYKMPDRVFYMSDETKTISQTPGEVNITCQPLLIFVTPSSVRMCWVTVSVLSSDVILGRSQLLGQTAGWKGIADWMVMEGREREVGIAGNIMHRTHFIAGLGSVE
jgi:hypothetical protein